MIITATPTIDIKLVSGTTLIFVPSTKESLDWLKYTGLLEMSFGSELEAFDALFYWVNYVRKEFNIGFIP